MVLAATTASAATNVVTNISESKLSLEDVVVKVTDVEGKTKKDSSVSVVEGGLDEADVDVTPLSKINMEFKFRNLYSENIEIENIATTVYIRGIDDDEDLEEEIKEFDLKEGRISSAKKPSFTAPLKIDEGFYDVDVEVEADDTNGTSYELVWTFQLKVDKDRHKVIIYKTELLDPEIEAGSSTDIGIGVINIGQEDEDDVVLEVTSKDLGLNKKEKLPEMYSDIDDDTNAVTRTYSISVPEDTKPGSYTVNAKISYRNDDKTDSVTKTITVLPAQEIVEPEPEQEQEPEETQVVIVQPPTTGTEEITGEVPLPGYEYIPPEDEEEPKEEGFAFGDYKYVALIGLAYLVVVIIGIVVAVKMFGRKEV